jgi:hypothetical protein
MKVYFITKTDFRADEVYAIYNKSYLYTIEVVKNNVSIDRKETEKLKFTVVDEIEDLYPQDFQYILPVLMNYYARLKLGGDMFFSVYFWTSDKNAYLYHSNTSWRDFSYYKKFRLDVEIEKQEKEDRSKNIMPELLKSHVVFESLDFLEEFDSFLDFVYKILDTLYQRHNELNEILKAKTK